MYFVVYFVDLDDLYTTPPTRFNINFGFDAFSHCFFGVLCILSGKHFVSMFSIGVGKYSVSQGFRHVGAVLHVFYRIFLRLADLDWLTWLAGMGCVG